MRFSKPRYLEDILFSPYDGRLMVHPRGGKAHFYRLTKEQIEELREMVG